jgi:hypothetical protein
VKIRGRKHFVIVTPVNNVDVALISSISCDEVRLSPLGTSANNWPIVPAPDDR